MTCVLRFLVCSLIVLGLSANLAQSAEEKAPETPSTAPSEATIHLNESFAADDRLRIAAGIVGDDRRHESIEAYQAIVDEFGSSVFYLKDAAYISLTDHIWDIVLANPAVPDLYDQIYSAEARAQIDAAIDSVDDAALHRACDRFYPSTAAHAGLRTAAEWAWERGEFSAAARLWHRLRAHPRSSAIQADLLFRAALAEKLAGEEDSARRDRDELAKLAPHAQGLVMGKTVGLLEILDRAAQPAAQTPRERDDQNTLKFWSIALPDQQPAAIGDAPPINFAGIAPGSGDASVSGPAAGNATVLIHTGDGVAAIREGKVLWRYPQTAEVVQKNLLSEQSRCVFADERVYALLNAVEDGKPAVDPNADPVLNAPVAPREPNTLVALNAGDGRPLWSVVSSSIPLRDGPKQADAAKKQLRFVGVPLVGERDVYVAGVSTASGISSYFLISLDRQTGAFKWCTFLCGANTRFSYEADQILTSVPLLQVADGFVYVATGQGADCAIHAGTGRTQWLQVTATGMRPSVNPNYGYQAKSGTPAWKYNPPIVYQDKLVTLETGAGLRVYNRWTGALLYQSAPHSGFDFADTMLMLPGSKLGLLGRSLIILDLSTLSHVADPLALPLVTERGRIVGRPWAVREGVEVPCEKGLLRLDPIGAKSVLVPWTLAGQQYIDPVMKIPDALPGLSRAGAARNVHLHIHDIFRLAQQHGRLHITSPLPRLSPATHRRFSAQLSGIDPAPGVAKISFSGEQLPKPILIFAYARADKPSQAILEVRLSFRALAIAYVAADGSRLDLTQTMSGPFGQADDRDGEAVITLRQPDVPPQTYRAPDLRTLRLDHPADFRKLVRPAVAALGDVRAAMLDDGEGYQILADRLPIDPAKEAKLLEILPRLNGTDPNHRDAASRELAALGWPLARAIDKLDRKTLTPEQRARLDELMKSYRVMNAAQLERARADLNVLVDCLGLADPVLVAAARDLLEQRTQSKIKLDPQLPQADRLAQIEPLRQQITANQAP